MSTTQHLLDAGETLRDEVNALTFAPPVQYVYNPLNYAWKAYKKYVETYAQSSKNIVFLGMNPGPFGMAQTGVPFGEISAVRDWLGINEPIGKPEREHSKRPIDGFNCSRSEVSGRRLWGLFAEKFGSANVFFKEHFVINYCPLVFAEESGRNRTPDKLPASEREALYAACDQHLKALVAALEPEWLIGVGGFAEGRAREILEGMPVRIGKVLHPSPASPAANRDWAGAATKQLEEQGIW
jgi:single-strand selective monofunctional uracil DNA glycosylase